MFVKINLIISKYNLTWRFEFTQVKLIIPAGIFFVCSYVSGSSMQILYAEINLIWLIPTPELHHNYVMTVTQLTMQRFPFQLKKGIKSSIPTTAIRKVHQIYLNYSIYYKK